MEMHKITGQKKIYHYQCSHCNSEFTKSSRINSNYCRNCNTTNNLVESTVKLDITRAYCPICNCTFETSDYLNSIFKNQHVNWLANMVTHYRHTHIEHWNKMWGAYGHYYRQGWNSNKDYDEMKHKVNEQAKRQILRKCKQFMIENGFTVEHVKEFKGTTEQTIELYQKTLNLKAVG